MLPSRAEKAYKEVRSSSTFSRQTDTNSLPRRRIVNNGTFVLSALRLKGALLQITLASVGGRNQGSTGMALRLGGTRHNMIAAMYRNYGQGLVFQAGRLLPFLHRDSGKMSCALSLPAPWRHASDATPSSNRNEKPQSRPPYQRPRTRTSSIRRIAQPLSDWHPRRLLPPSFPVLSSNNFVNRHVKFRYPRQVAPCLDRRRGDCRR